MVAIPSFTINHKLKERIDKNLDVLRTVYAVSFIVGYNRIGAGFPDAIIDHKNLVYYLLCLLAIALSVRLYWGVGNIRRHLYHAIGLNNLPAGPNPQTLRTISKPQLQKIMLGVMLFHVPMLLSQAFVFYLLCRSVSDYIGLDFIILSDLTTMSNSTDYFLFYIAILFINVIWLISLLRQRTNRQGSPEFLWLTNNALVGIACLLVYFICDISYLTLTIVIILIFLNTVIDLIFTSYAYIIEAPG